MNLAKFLVKALLIWACTCGSVLGYAQPSQKSLDNDVYELRLLPSGAIEVGVRGIRPQLFSPIFTILSRMDNPKLVYKQQIPSPLEENLAMPNWLSRDGSEKRVWNLFEAANSTLVKLGKGELMEGEIKWAFSNNSDFEFSAWLSLPPGTAEPLLQFRFTPKRDGWYSVGYTGAPTLSPETLDELWQPLIWQEKRFPRLPFLSAEAMCPLPVTFMTRLGTTIGVAADPDESPFRMPTAQNSRFGVLLRNPVGKAQPMVFAPVLGDQSSKMKAGESFEFKLRLMVHAGTCFESYKYLSHNLYGFHDYRENATCSLNETLENMISFGMDDQYSGWNADLRGFDYSTDVKNTVKVVSALHPLSIAMLTDNKEIYYRRALPMIEYLMSRQRFLFTTDPDQKGQGASALMKGPAAEVSELAALFAFSKKHTAAFKYYAGTLLDKPRILNLDVEGQGSSWQSLLAMYRVTGDLKYIERAKAGADQYIAERIATPLNDFRTITQKTGNEFWVDYTPKWFDLLEMYEETREQRYLNAALTGARLYTNYVWLQPCVTESSVIINPGGKTFFGAFAPKRIAGSHAMEASEQSVPTWRVSQIGLTPEASSTYLGNPAIFLTTFAPPFLRLTQYTGDIFFREIARSAVVGRYANFPGYSIKGEYTTIYSRPDFPLRPWVELTYNNIYYNHIWPQIALMADYLITDAIVRSQGQIDFPARYNEGYAYLKGRVYGDRPGKFFGDEGVMLWMPPKLLHIDNIQVNYIAGYGNGKLYIALTNQSASPVDAKIMLNPDVASFDISKDYKVKVWHENKASIPSILHNGELNLAISANGITSFSVEDLNIVPAFQSKIFTADATEPSSGSYAETIAPFGKFHSMLISFGQSITSCYVWLEATAQDLAEARLYYKQNGETKTISDTKYPFEFSLPLNEQENAFEFWVEGIRPDGSVQGSAKVTLHRQSQ